MGEYFKGWRRKTGCVTLAIACVLLAVWVRSQSNPTTFSAPIDAMTEYGLKLDPDRIAVIRTRVVLPTADQQVTLDDDGTVIIENKARDDHSTGNIAKTRYPNGRVSMFNWSICVDNTIAFLDAPYWPIVLSLTLLSAYLLLVKPRVAKPKSVGEN